MEGVTACICFRPCNIVTTPWWRKSNGKLATCLSSKVLSLYVSESSSSASSSHFSSFLSLESSSPKSEKRSGLASWHLHNTVASQHAKDFALVQGEDSPQNCSKDCDEVLNDILDLLCSKYHLQRLTFLQPRVQVSGDTASINQPIRFSLEFYVIPQR